MIAIKAPTAFRPVDSAYLFALAHPQQNFSPVHEIAHLMESLDRWVMQHLLVERLTEYAVPPTSLEELVTPYHTYIETFDSTVPPGFTSAVTAQKRAERRRVAKSDAKDLQTQHRAICAAPATATLSGSMTPVQTMLASTSGLSNLVVNPPLAIGGSPQTMRVMVLVLVLTLMFALGFQLFSYHPTLQQEETVSIETSFDNAVTGIDSAQLTSQAPTSSTHGG
jgi:hypothetical protein